MRVKRALAALAGAWGVGVMSPAPALAHGFGERYDLPLPLWMYLVGAGATVALSFVVIGIFVKAAPGRYRYPRHNLRAHGWFRGIFESRLFLLTVQALSVGLYALVIATGLFGNEAPVLNFAPPFVWIIWWVGMAYVSALLGNLWALVNPWSILFSWVERLYTRLTGDQGLSLEFNYPGWLGVWPGVVFFFAWAWLENAYPDPAAPRTIAVLTIGYSLITWGGMLLFGRHHWLRHGEAFSLLFGFLARFAPTEARVVDSERCQECDLGCGYGDGECVDCYQCYELAGDDRQLNLRPYAVGLGLPVPVGVDTLAFVVMMLSTVTFDGFRATPAWVTLGSAIHSLFSSMGLIGSVVAESIGMGLFIGVFLGVYLIFCRVMGAVSGDSRSGVELARSFVFSIIPIAIGYHLAHYFGYLAIQGQLMIPLVSDPFGAGWDLFGTSGYQVSVGVVNVKFIWFLSVAAIVIAHIVAVYLSHIVSFRAFPVPSMALRSQYPMLALMVGYTMTSLWIIAQPIVGK